MERSMNDIIHLTANRLRFRSMAEYLGYVTISPKFEGELEEVNEAGLSTRETRISIHLNSREAASEQSANMATDLQWSARLR